MNSFPKHPLEAVTHPDPYPYYAALVHRGPIHFDEPLGLWVVVGVEGLHAALTHPHLRVRPAQEPIPAALQGHASGDVFRGLVRMRDGEAHSTLKAEVTSLLEDMFSPQLEGRCARWAGELARDLHVATQGAGLDRFLREYPAFVLGDLMGVEARDLPGLSTSARHLAACFAPGATAADVKAQGEAWTSDMARLAALPRVATLPEPLRGPNAMGFLTQAHDATAGLMGNALVALGRHPQVFEQLEKQTEGWLALMDATLAWDPPVHNTRRFASEPLTLLGQDLPAGAGLLLVLASGGPLGDGRRFRLSADPPRGYAFGAGVHACPGQALARRVAAAGLSALIQAGVNPRDLVARVSYRPSLNARMPLFAKEEGR